MLSLSAERLAPVNGIEIAYQEIGDPDADPLLLIMGLAVQMIGWDEEFCAMLAERGFRVVRFDNRDVGHSTILGEAGVAGRLDALLGRRSTAPYLLRDMAADTEGLMDHLGIDAAHLVGVSMGGMIAQTIAIHQPRRVKSLVSMMSTTGNRRLGLPSWRAFGAVMASQPREREAAIERAVHMFKTIGSPAYPMDEERFRDLAGRSFDRSHSRSGVLRQLHAITASGDRTSDLRKLRLPVTVIHGSADPLVRPAAGRATAKAIPGAHLCMIDGMGHDLPRELWPTIIDQIVATTERAGGARSLARAR
jgi:pimeloyl-ACP methyl ester carboxylesterase